MNRLGILLLALLSACGTRADFWDESLSVLGPVQSAGSLVYVQANSGMLTVLSPESASLQHVEVTRKARALAASPKGVIVVGGRGEVPALDFVSLPTLERSRLSLPGAYDRIALSQSGRFAVLSYDPSRPPAPGGPAARNNNEITIADLDSMSLDTFALRTESLSPQSVVFSPDGLVAAVVLDAAVAFIDLQDPSVRVHVPLKLPNGRALVPQEAHFSHDGAFLFVRAQGSDDVLSLELLREGGRLQSAINFLFFPGASGLQDILVPEGEDFTRRVAALYSSSTGTHAVLLDAQGDTSKTLAVEFTRGLTTLSDLGDGYLLGWSDPALSSASASRAIAGWAPLLGRKDEDLLQGSLQSEPRFSRSGAFFPHGVVGEGSDARAALTGITLEDDGSRLRVRLSPLVLAGRPTATALDPHSGTLFVSVSVHRNESGASSSGASLTSSIVALRPDSLSIEGLVLDTEVSALGFAGSHLYAQHPSDFGDLSLVPLSDLSRSAARRLSGFLLGHLAERGEQ